MPMLKDHIATIAAREIGMRENPIGSNRGPRVDQYQAATWLKKKDWGPWCAAFICWVLREAMKAGAKDGAKYTFKRPQTARAFDFEDWSLQQDASTRTRRKPGMDIEAWDIVIFDFSHIAFATGKPNAKGQFCTLEGNTNDEGSREGYEVARRIRNIKNVTVRIRITV